MKYKQLSIIIVSVWLLATASVTSADTILFGYTYSSSDFVDDAPLGANNVWKAVRVSAYESGYINYFQFYLGGFASISETSNEVGWGVYDDDNNSVGAKICEGYVSGYDWTDIGPNAYHIFNATSGNCQVTRGQSYWMVFHASGEENILLARGRVSGCDNNQRIGTDQYSWTLYNAPPPTEFVNVYNAGCYAWSVWESSGSNPDNQSPEVNIVEPNAGDEYITYSSPLHISGTASDNREIHRVAWTNDRGGTGVCVGLQNWETDIPIFIGYNLISITAWDVAGNFDIDTLIVNHVNTDNISPYPPNILWPEDDDTDVPLNPQLQSGPFFDETTNDTHTESNWQIALDPSFNFLVYEVYSRSFLYTLPIPHGILDIDTRYFWRIRYADASGNYSIWSSICSFDTIQSVDSNDPNGNGIPDIQEITSPNVDLNEDGVPDINQSNIVCINTFSGDTQVGIDIQESSNVSAVTSISSIDPNTIPNLPENYQMPFGMLSFRLELLNSNNPVSVVIYFSEPVPAEFVWLKYDSINGSYEYTEHVTLSNNRKMAILDFWDGLTGDSDNIRNNRIVDPSGPAVLSSESTYGDGNSGEGCFIATAVFGAENDPNVMILRQFRNRFLQTNFLGKLFIYIYYKYSPRIAASIEKSSTVEIAIRLLLQPIVYACWLCNQIGLLPSFVFMSLFLFLIFRSLYYFNRHIHHNIERI